MFRFFHLIVFLSSVMFYARLSGWELAGPSLRQTVARQHAKTDEDQQEG